MKIFVTGGTGFLGKVIIERLLQDNHQVIALTRRPNVFYDPVKEVLGNLENIDLWKQSLQDCDVVVHCAAPVEFWGPWEKYQKGIVDATKNLFLASDSNNVKQFIYISSESVLQDRKNLIDIDETEPYPQEPNSYYGKSKMLAEKFILSQKSKMKSIILRPPFIWGVNVKALDIIVNKIHSKSFMWINNGNSLFEMVHVKNVAEAVSLAIKNGQNKDKEIYFVTDDNPQTVKSFLTKLMSTRGITPPNKSIPKWLALMLANVFEWIWKTFNLKSTPMITRFDVAFVSMDRSYDISKIKKDLHYQPVISESKGLEEMKR